MKKITVVLLTFAIILLIASCADSDNKTVETVPTSSPISKPLHTMYAVGDIKDFNENLRPLAEKLVDQDPNASWWILGDAGYGEGAEVTGNYEQIVQVLDENVILNSIIGDHDYGTQDPTKFTTENRVATGSEKLLNAKQNFSFGISNSGELIETKSAQKASKLSWSLVGSNDICVETGPDLQTECNEKLFEDFKNNIVSSSKRTTCSIAMYHHPVFAVIKDGGNDQEFSEIYGTPYWETAVSNGVDIVLNADHHQFVATKKIGINGKLHLDEMSTPFTRQFIVGTGGAPLSSDRQTPKLAVDAIDKDIRNQVGVLKIDLYSSKAKLSFVTLDGTLYTSQVDC